MPEVEGDEPEFEEPELDEPEFAEPDDLEPVLGDDPVGEPAVPGMVPQGETLGEVPGVVVVLGFTVEGCVLLPEEGGLVEFAPGTLEGDVGGFTEPVGGAV